jgi:hypothetical protein
MSEVDSLIICNEFRHQSGERGCFRCIDNDLLVKLILMAKNKKVKIYAVDISITDTVTKSSDEIDAEIFFKFLYGQKICFKVFFEDRDFFDEFKNIKILKTIPGVKRKDIREESSSKSDEDPLKPQQNFLEKYTTYYQYQHQSGKDVAFMLEFEDKVEINSSSSSKRTNKVYIILNKFCKILRGHIEEKILSEQFHDEIYEALMILTSHGYCHGDTKFDNIVDCGESSNPRYKLIDFSEMKETRLKIGTRRGYQAFLNEIDDFTGFVTGRRGIRWQKVLDAASKKPKDYEINAATFAARVAADAAKKEQKTKFEVVKKYYYQLRELLRYTISNYMSYYILSLLTCNVYHVTIVYKKELEINYDIPVEYPSAVFQFESEDGFENCKKRLNLPPWVKLLPNLKVNLDSKIIQDIYEKMASSYDVTSRKIITDLYNNISSIGIFLSKYSHMSGLDSNAEYKTELDKYFILIIDTFKNIEIPGMSESDFAAVRFSQKGGQTRCKLKRSTCKKKKIKSKNKTRTKLNNKTRTKLNNKTRTK